MREIHIKNPKILETPYSIISEKYSSGTSLTIEDSSGFYDDDLILIGGVGNEKSEATDLTATPPNDTTLTVSSLKFIHDIDESIEKILWDQFDIQYKTTVAGSWIDLVTSRSFSWDKDITSYVHESGASTYYYRSRYYNSATEQYSSWSNIASGAGFNRNEAGFVLKQVRKKTKTVGDKDITDDYIFSLFNDVQDIVKGFNKRFWFLKDKHAFVTAASTKEYSELPDDFDRGHRLKFNYVSGSTDKTIDLTYKTPKEFDYLTQDNTISDSDYLKIYTIDEINETIKVGPAAPETADLDLTLIYYKKLTDIDSYSDELLIPLPGLYLHYACKVIFSDKENPEKHNYHDGEFSNLLEIIKQMKNRVDRPRSFKLYKGRSGMDERSGSLTEYSDDNREKNW